MEVSTTHVPHTSQNLGADLVTRQYFIHFSSIQPTQAQVTVDPTTKGPSDDRSTSQRDYDKWVALEERLRIVEGNNLTDLILAAEVCLVSNIMVPKEFSVLDFVKYTELECPNTHLWSYYNKMVEVMIRF